MLSFKDDNYHWNVMVKKTKDISSSSEESSEEIVPKKQIKKPVNKTTKPPPKKTIPKSKKDSSDDEDNSPPQKGKNVKKTPISKKAQKDDNSSDDENSSPPQKRKNVKKTPVKKTPISKKVQKDDENENSSEDEDSSPPQKRKNVKKTPAKKTPAKKKVIKKEEPEEKSFDSEDISIHEDKPEAYREDLILEVKTNQTGYLKNVIERITQVMSECCIVFVRPDPSIKNDDDDDDFFEDVDENSGSKKNRRRELAEQEGIELDSEDSAEESEEKPKKTNKKTKQVKPVKKVKEAPKSRKGSSGGIRIHRLTEDRNVLIKLVLYAEEFELFRCEEPKITVGVDMHYLHNLLKPINDNVPIVLYMKRDNRSVMYIHCETSNEKQREEKDIEVFLMDISNPDIRLEKVKFTNKINLTADKFHSICKDMHTNSTFVEITSVNNEIHFIGQSEGGKITMVYSDPNFEPREDSDQIIQGVYELRNLMYFSKCKKLCDTVDIYMRNDYPLVIILSVSTLGKMYVFLTPIDLPS